MQAAISCVSIVQLLTFVHIDYGCIWSSNIDGIGDIMGCMQSVFAQY